MSNFITSLSIVYTIVYYVFFWCANPVDLRGVFLTFFVASVFMILENQPPYLRITR